MAGGALPALLPASSGAAGTFYVDPVNGSDSGSGSIGNPWRTINKALQSVPGSGGAIINVVGNGVSITQTQGGQTNALIYLNRSFDPNNPVTLQCVTKWGVKLTSNYAFRSDIDHQVGWQNALFADGNASGIRIKGFNFDEWYGGKYQDPNENFYGQGTTPVVFSGSHNIDFLGNRVTRAGGMGLVTQQVTRVHIFGNWFENNGVDSYDDGTTGGDQLGGAFYWGPNLPESTYGQGTHHMYLGQLQGATTNCLIARNVIRFSMPGYHIEAGPNFQQNFIVNNTFVRSRGGNTNSSDFIQFFDNGGVGTKNNEVRNNLFVDGRGRTIYGGNANGGSSSVGHYLGNAAFNSAWQVDASLQGGGGDPYNANYGGGDVYSKNGGNNTVDNPAFVNQSGGDFHLTSGTAANIKTGADANYTPPVDFDGVAPSATPSRGAFELTTSGGGPVNPPPTPSPGVTAPPVISGTVLYGSTLTCSDGTWDNAVSFTKAWQSDVSGNGVFTNTGLTGNTFQVRFTDISDRIRVVVTATGPGGSTQTITSPVGPVPPLTASASGTYLQTVQGGANAATIPATITPSSVGNTLVAIISFNSASVTTIHPGDISDNKGNVWSYAGETQVQNERLVAAICSGVTSATSTIVQANLSGPANGVLTVFEFSGMDPLGTVDHSVFNPQGVASLSHAVGSQTASSNSFGWVACGVMTANAPGAVTVDAAYTGTGTSTQGTCTASAVYKMFHQRGGTTTSTWTSGNSVTSSQVILLLRDATPNPLPVCTVLPTIDPPYSPYEVGQSLTCLPGTWTNSPGFVYQWLRRNPVTGLSTSIGAEVAQGYTIKAADLGMQVACQVDATSAAFPSDPVRVFTPYTDAITGGVGPPSGGGSGGSSDAVAPILIVSPRLSGIFNVGNRITCSTGTWQSATTIAYTYIWLVSDSNGLFGNFTSGTETANNFYDLRDANFNKRVKCWVVARN